MGLTVPFGSSRFGMVKTHGSRSVGRAHFLRLALYIAVDWTVYYTTDCLLHWLLIYLLSYRAYYGDRALE